jgi:hypothetical protein
MAAERVADMTIEELKTMIRQIVEEELQHRQGLAMSHIVKEVLDSTEHHHTLTPSAGQMSAVEILLEERKKRGEL